MLFLACIKTTNIVSVAGFLSFVMLD